MHTQIFNRFSISGSTNRLLLPIILFLFPLYFRICYGKHVGILGVLLGKIFAFCGSGSVVSF